MNAPTLDHVRAGRDDLGCERRLFSLRVLLFLLPGLVVLFTARASAQFYVFGRANLAAGANPHAVVAADLNGDGRLDLVVANHDSGSITVLLGKPDGTFSPGVDYGVGQGPRALATGDFNGDGILDLAVLNSGDNSVSILQGMGDGTFQIMVTLAVGNMPTAAVVGDFNHDGKLDLAIANGATPGSVSILLGNGDGSFQPHHDYGTGDSPAALAAGDFNADGILDLIVANQSSSTVSILLGSGDGTFQTHVDYASGNAPVSVALGDFNGDGILDAAVANASDRSVSVLLGNADGTFQNRSDFFLGLAPVSLIVGDFNGDHKADIVLAGTSNPLGAVGVLLGNGDGTFQSAADFDLASQPAALCAGDFNGDGRLDLAIADPDINSVTVLVGNGKGTFPTHVEYPTGTWPRLITSADLNQDGKPDLVTTNWLGNSVSVLLGNGDGTFKTNVDFATGNSPFGLVAGDFNGDGKIDLVVTNSQNVSTSSFSVLLGNGDGTFRPHVDTSLGIILVGVVAGDFNGDGKLDLGLLNGGTPPFHISIVPGKGDGTFGPPVNYETGIDPISAVTADFNRDGKLDLAVSNQGGISVLLGNGDGTFGGQQLYSTGDTPYSLVAGDFNGDGNLDLATANLGAHTASVLLGNGDGTFRTHVDYQTGNFSVAVSVGDINGDGKPDLVVSNGSANTVSVLLGNGDGTFQPRMDYPTGNGPEGSFIGDFNGDGGMDLAVAGNFSNAVSVFLNTPVIAFYPSQIAFAGQPIGTASPGQQIWLSNPGSMPIRIESIATSGDYAQQNTCGESVAVGANCEISVTFSPTAVGSRLGSVIITDSVPGSPHLISLGGAGTAPAPVVSLSPTSLAFSSAGLGSLPSTQTVTLSNTGDATLTLSSVAISGANQQDFSQTNTCGSNVNPGAACTITVTFAPTLTSGNETATLTFNDNAGNSPQRVPLTGTIAGSAANFSPTRLTFPSQPVGTTSLPLSVAISVSGAGDFSIQSITITGDFAQTNTCGTSVPANGSCTINVTFTPSTTGDRGGVLTILHASAPTVIGLDGSGGDFTITVNTATLAVPAGQTATYSLALTPIGGFNQPVSFGCAGAPQHAQCLAPPTITSNGLDVITFSVQVFTTARSTVEPQLGNRPRTPYYLPASLPLPIFAALAMLTGLCALRWAGAARKFRPRIILAATLLLIFIWVACGGAGGGYGGGGGGGISGTPAGSYTLTVTGAYRSGSTVLKHIVIVTLTVN